MADTGFVSPGAFASVENTIGDIAWSDPANAGASDNSRATATVSSSGFTQELRGTSLGLSIPADPDGIEVTIERNTAGGGATVFTDNLVQLIKGGTPGGDNKASATAWNTTEDTITYGGPTDLWGQTWTAADINASTFGVLLRAQRAGSSGQTAQVDHIQIKVYYTAGGDDHVLTINDATHAHTADVVTLSQAHVLAIADAVHAHTADNVTLDTGAVLAIDDAAHAHTADVVTLSQAHVLAIADAVHAHTADNVTLVTVETALDIAAALHGHTAAEVLLGQNHILDIQSAFHGHVADEVTFSGVWTELGAASTNWTEEATNSTNWTELG